MLINFMKKKRTNLVSRFDHPHRTKTNNEMKHCIHLVSMHNTYYLQYRFFLRVI